MADTKQQYEWAESWRFRTRLIPSILIGALIGPFLVDVVFSFFISKFEIAIHGHDPTQLHWPSILDCILGIPLGGGLGYAFGILKARGKLKWVRWAKDHGWQFVATPGNSLSEFLEHADDLEESCLYWPHAMKRDLLARRFGKRGVVVHTAVGLTHVDLLHGKHSAKEKSSMAGFLVLDANSECPDMVIHSRTLADHLKLPSHLQSVDFELLEFNQKWTVKAKEPKAAYDRLSQEVLEFLLDKQPELLIEFVGGLLVIQYRLLEHSLDMYDPLSVYRHLFHFAEAWTQVIPEDLLGPISLDAGALRKH